MRVEELRALIAGQADDDVVDMYLPGETGTVGRYTAVMPGVPGFVTQIADGETTVQVKVGKLRHVLRLLEGSSGEPYHSARPSFPANRVIREGDTPR